MSNPYLQFFLEDSYKSQIYSASRKDYSYEYKNNIHKDYPLTNGFMDFSKDILHLSASEIVQHAGNNKDVIIDFLYSPDYQDNIRKQEWIEFFTPVLKNDFKFFQNSLNLCLLKHIKNKTAITESSDKYRQYHIEHNEKDFHNLVQIGKNSNFLKNITQEQLLTENKDYQLYLEKENLFENNFSVEQLIKECFLGEENRLKKYLSTISSQLITTLINDPTIIETIFSHDLETLPNNIYNSKIPEKFIEVLFKNNFAVEKGQYEQFIKQLLQNPTIKQYMLESNNSILILDNYPDLLIPFLDNLTNEQKVNFYNANYSFQSTSSKGIGLLKHIYIVMDDKDTVNKTYSIELVDYLYKNIYQQCAIDPDVLDYDTMEKRKSLNSMMGVQILKTCSKMDNGNKNLENHTIFTQEHMKKYHSLITESFELNGNKVGDKLKQLKIISEKIDSGLKDKIINAIAIKIQDELFHMFKPHLDYQGKFLDRSYDINQSNESLKNLVLFIKYFNKSEVLDILRPDPNKPRWSEIYLDLDDRLSNKKSKFYADLPLSFYLIKESQGDLLSWFSQEGNLAPLSKITFKNKKLLNFYKGDLPLFTKMVKEVVLDSYKFSALLENAKPVLQAAKDLQDPEIEKALNYHSLSKLVEKNIIDKVELIKPKKKI